MLVIVIFGVIQEADAKTWKVYLNPIPKQWENHFGDVYYDATKYWEKRVPGTYFTEISQREKADFVVQWSSKFEGNKLGYYTPSSNNDFGRPYIAVTLGYMDDSSVKFQDRKFHLVDAEYAKLITTHEIGHAIGFDHSDDRNDIMYPTIYDYDSWLQKKYQTGISLQSNNIQPQNIITQYNSKTIPLQEEVNSKVDEAKGYIYSKQDLLLSKKYQNPEAQKELDKAWTKLGEAKDYLSKAEWTQKEGEEYLFAYDHEGAYYKYLYSQGMINKVWDPILEINSAIHSADTLESEYKNQVIQKQTPTSEQNEKTCFWIFCW